MARPWSPVNWSALGTRVAGGQSVTLTFLGKVAYARTTLRYSFFMRVAGFERRRLRIPHMRIYQKRSGPSRAANTFIGLWKAITQKQPRPKCKIRVNPQTAFTNLSKFESLLNAKPLPCPKRPLICDTRCVACLGRAPLRSRHRSLGGYLAKLPVYEYRHE